MSRRGWVLFVALSLIWGVPYLLLKVAVEDLSPAVVVLLRTALAAAMLLPVALLRGELAPVLRRWRWVLVFAAVEIAVPFWLLGAAEQHLSSSLTGLLVAAVPFVAAIAGRLLREERLTPVRVAGMALGVVGIAVLLGLDVGGAALVPLLAVALTVIGYGTAPMIVTRQLADVDGVAASSVALTVTAVVYAPFALTRTDEVAEAPGRALLSVVVLGLVCTAVALSLFFALIREVGPQRALVITFLNPAVAVLLGVLLLDEPFTLGLALGLPLVVAGCVLATRRNEPRAAPDPAVETPVP
jgi:drug/metabolite transporter (DMT)-like permease